IVIQLTSGFAATKLISVIWRTVWRILNRITHMNVLRGTSLGECGWNVRRGWEKLAEVLEFSRAKLSTSQQIATDRSIDHDRFHAPHRTRSQRGGNSTRRYRSRQPVVRGLDRSPRAGVFATGDGIDSVRFPRHRTGRGAHQGPAQEAPHHCRSEATVGCPGPGDA